MKVYMSVLKPDIVYIETGSLLRLFCYYFIGSSNYITNNE